MTAIPKHTQLPRGNADVQIIGPSVLKPLKIKVFHEMDTVILNIDGTELKMPWPYAISLSSLLRTHAKQAKKLAGDASKTLHTSAVLTNAEENYKKGW